MYPGKEELEARKVKLQDMREVLYKETDAIALQNTKIIAELVAIERVLKYHEVSKNEN